MLCAAPFLLMVSWPVGATNFTVVPTWAGAVAPAEKLGEKRLDVWGCVVAVEPKRPVPVEELNAEVGR